jgi:uncharacterized protein YceK
MKKIIRAMVLLGIAVVFSGCSGMTYITSNPDGATISLNGNYIGETPMNYDVKDIFGWFSVYAFTATKKGYRPETKAVKERWMEDAAATIPPHIHFDLAPLPPEEKK